jgi:hypothetical protein
MLPIGQYACMAEQGAVPTGWNWAYRSYKNHAGDAEWLMREALRRAIDIRDISADGESLSARPLMLVDVLHALRSALDFEDVDTITFWSEFDV